MAGWYWNRNYKAWSRVSTTNFSNFGNYFMGIFGIMCIKLVLLWLPVFCDYFQAFLFNKIKKITNIQSAGRSLVTLKLSKLTILHKDASSLWKFYFVKTFILSGKWRNWGSSRYWENCINLASCIFSQRNSFIAVSRRGPWDRMQYIKSNILYDVGVAVWQKLVVWQIVCQGNLIERMMGTLKIDKKI